MTTIFFATDVHGSEICWKKFINAGKFYNADILVLGGDMTGKALVPFIKDSKGMYKVNLKRARQKWSKIYPTAATIRLK